MHTDKFQLKSKRVPATFTKKPLTAFTLEDYQENARLLADKLETVDPRQHDQVTWGRISTDHPCGTTGCALAIAAMSHIIPGLQYCVTGHGEILPVINGKPEPLYWAHVGEMFFGKEVTVSIFLGTNLSKHEVIKRLRYFAQTGKVQARRRS